MDAKKQLDKLLNDKDFKTLAVALGNNERALKFVGEMADREIAAELAARIAAKHFKFGPEDNIKLLKALKDER